MSFKYVMFQYEWRGIQYHYPLIFPEQLTHSEVADAHRHYKHGTEQDWVRPRAVSAGFVHFEGRRAVCHGDSESLKLKPHPDDALIIVAAGSASAMFPR